MANATNGEDDPVIEGEFIEADESSPGTSSDNPETGLSGDKPRSGLRRAMGWLPWLLLLMVLIFIGGLFAAPFVEQQLVTYGLMSPRESVTLPVADQNGTDRNDSTHIILRLDDLELTLTAMGRRLKTIETALAAISEESADTKNRLDIIGERPASSDGSTDSTSVDITSYEARLSAMRERLDALEATVNTDVASERNARMTLSDRLAAAQSERQRLNLNIDALSGRLNQLEQPAPQAQLTVTPGIFPAILALGRHLENGTAYDKTMAPLQSWFADQPEAKPAIDTLSYYAPSGVVTLSALRRDFDPLVNSIIKAERTGQAAQEDKGLFSTLKDKVAGIVVIHPKDSEAQEGLSAHLAGAKRALEDGKLEDAVTILESLAPEIRAPAASWLEQARDRMAATNAFHDLLGLLQNSQGRRNTGQMQERP